MSQRKSLLLIVRIINNLDEESDLMSAQRNELHRQNEKFMKDLKKKA